MGIFTKGINRGAYRGKLTCPVCNSNAIRFVENVAMFRQRYRCRKCGFTFQYDISGSVDDQGNFGHPYAPFTKNKWRHMVDAYGRTKKEISK